MKPTAVNQVFVKRLVKTAQASARNPMVSVQPTSIDAQPSLKMRAAPYTAPLTVDTKKSLN